VREAHEQAGPGELQVSCKTLRAYVTRQRAWFHPKRALRIAADCCRSGPASALGHVKKASWPHFISGPIYISYPSPPFPPLHLSVPYLIPSSPFRPTPGRRRRVGPYLFITYCSWLPRLATATHTWDSSPSLFMRASMKCRLWPWRAASSFSADSTSG